MSIDRYIVFVTLTLFYQLSPGPAVILAINNGIKYGLKNSTVAVLGNVIALLMLVIVSATGLGAVLAASESFFKILKIIGALYLIYLGIKLWISPSKESLNSVATHSIRVEPTALFLQAFFITLSSPKALVYVSALLPQFVDINEIILPQVITLGLTMALIQFFVFMSYAAISSRAKRWLECASIRNLFNKFSGAIFIGFGVSLGMSGNKT